MALRFALLDDEGVVRWEEDGAEDILQARSHADYICWMDSFKRGVQDALKDIARETAE